MSKIAIVTGGSSGIGLNVAMCLKNAGCTVYEFSRREVPNSPFHHISTDVTDEAAVQSAVKQVLEKEEKIDILVNCAGFGISGAAEFTELADAKRQLDVNFFGMVNVTKAVLTPMRNARGGRIVNISSVAAPIPIPFQTFYSASKAAINSYTCAVANEVAPYGISMCAIQPGDISSGFTDARKKSIEGDTEYGGRIRRSVEVMEKDERGGMKPSVAAAYICKIALKKKVKPLYAIGFSYKAFCVIMKVLPIGLSNKMIGMIYAK
ncbi:MAG: SDR family NAD(P)-dependent oxidoreductase [Lachnospiraceae bacterium]|nr:SDR family NAD(P)-dependent oxidoreductase [Lachnospiraceae bacterium]